MRQFQLKRYNISMYLHKLGRDNVCRKMLIYQVLGDPTFPIPKKDEKLLPLDNGKRLVVLIHGFSSDSDKQFPKDIAKVLCERSHDTNVVVVDWGQLAFDDSLTKFENAVNYVVFVAGYVTQFLVSMNQKFHLDPNKTHIIGHSLGSYVAAYAARGFQSLSQSKIDRITVLDPPFRLRIDTSLNFNLSDAVYIDVIHTSWLTKGNKIGHVDFYVNPQLRTQPGCGVVDSGSCSHAFAYIVFLESITSSTQFTAKKCQDRIDGAIEWEKCMCPEVYMSMGYGLGWRDRLGATLDDVSGEYSLETSLQAPYAKNNCPNWGPGT